MLDLAQALLDWINANPRGSLLLLFLVAMGDALFLVGAFVPAAVVLFGMGALVALGSLPLWPTALIAAAGALAGDGLSFALGRRYGESLFESRWVRRYPDLILHGRNFFERHGGKGVMLARFLGPVRSITPALAGASGMSAILFVVVDSMAALAWALVYLVPGILFGASLGLAAEVATRLAGLLVVIIALMIGGIWLVRASVALFNRHAERRVQMLLRWSRRHRRLGRFGPGLADPAQPETPALIAVAALLLVCGTLWLIVFGGAGWRHIPGALDALIQQTLSDLSTPWGTASAHYISRLGQWPVYASTATVVLASLLWSQRMRAAAHWVAAMLFGVTITLLLEWLPLVPPPARYFDYIAVSAPLRDLAMPIIIYGFGATLFVTLRPRPLRTTAYALISTLILLICLSRLVLGQEWATLIGFCMIMGLLWIFALSLGYRQHNPERLFSLSFFVPVMMTFAAAVAMSWGIDRAVSRLDAPTLLEDSKIQTPVHWSSGGWLELPQDRIDVRGQASRAFDFQWAAQISDIRSELADQGWREIPAHQTSDTLRWLTQSTGISELPVLPQVHAGRHPVMSLRRPIDDKRQELIRLWDSGVRIEQAQGDVPVWLGLLLQQKLRKRGIIFRYPVTLDVRAASAPLSADTPKTRVLPVEKNGHQLWLMGAAYVLHYTVPPKAVSAPSGADEP